MEDTDLPSLSRKHLLLVSRICDMHGTTLAQELGKEVSGVRLEDIAMICYNTLAIHDRCTNMTMSRLALRTIINHSNNVLRSLAHTKTRQSSHL